MPTSLLRRAASTQLAFLTVIVLATNHRASAAEAPPWTRPSGFTATIGGDEGRTIAVNTLDAEGPGSLADAIAASGPRKITFSVAGEISLHGTRLAIKNGDVTIAGETAPSPGVTLRDGGVNVSGHDVIIRHIHIRPGAAGHESGPGWDIDGLSTVAAHDVVVDHCSFSWATDENLSASGPRFEGKDPDAWRQNTSHNITFSHNIIAEGLFHSVHTKKTGHSMGTLIHDNVTGVTIVGNLFLSNNQRNPLFKGGARGVVVNNLIQNPGNSAMQFALVPSEWTDREYQRGQMAIVGNVMHRGPSTSKDLPLIRMGSGTNVPACDAYIHDNLVFDEEGQRVDDILKVVAYKPTAEESAPTDAAATAFREVKDPPLWPKELVARPAEQTAEWVLSEAGARPWDRDPIDQRMIVEARRGTGRIIDHEREAPAPSDD